MSKKISLLLLVVPVLLLVFIIKPSPTEAELETIDYGWTKPDGGLSVDIRPEQEQVAAGTPLDVLLNVVAQPGISSVDATLDTEGPVSVVQGQRSFRQTTIAGGTVTGRSAVSVGAAGEGVVSATVRAFDADGQEIISRIDQFYVLVADGQVYTSLSGTLDLHVKHLQDQRKRGLLVGDAYDVALETLLGAGASESVTLSSSTGSSANITVKGRIQYRDSGNNPHPARSVKVEIRDEELIGSDLVATVKTDANGDFSKVVDNNDGVLQAGRDIFIRVLAASDDFEIKPPSGAVHRIDSSVNDDVVDGATVTINLTANNTDDNNTAFSVADAMTMVMEYAPRVNGGPFPFVTVIFPTNKSTSLYDGTKLHVLQLDRFDWDVVHHEYGHYVMDRLNIENNPGGKHTSGTNMGETRGKDAGTRLAWGEGWPTYFGTSLQQVQNGSAMNIPNVGDTSYQDTEDLTLNYSLESTGSKTAKGEDDELSTQRILWDIYDSADDAGDQGVAWGDKAVWSTLDAADPTRLSTAYAALVQGKSTQEQVRIGCIFSEHNVAPEPTAPADGILIGNSPPKFEWNAYGGGPSNRNDKFFVEFYNADFSKQIFKSAELGATNYTPSQADWDTIRNDGTVLVNWVVRGRQTNAPATGPYLGCQRRLVQKKLDLVFAIDATGSMWDDIDLVAQSATDIVQAIDDSGADYRIGLVTYKDHPVDPYGDPGDYPSRIELNFSTDAATIQAAINAIVVNGGNDWPEAVYSGVMTSLSFPWRPGVSKAIIPMGDAPPHDPEPFTGFTMASVIMAANNLTVTVPLLSSTEAMLSSSTVESASIYPVVIGPDLEADAAFSTMAEGTGGDIVSAATADQVVGAILESIDNILSAPFADAGGPYQADVGVPLHVYASNSFDIDGEIVSYEWDFDDDGSYDLITADVSATHTYTQRYEGLLRLRVTDNNSQVGTATAAVQALVPPVADAGGPYNPNRWEETAFDASASFDPDDAISLYEWDFDNDGVFDASGPEAMASYTYDVPYDGIAHLRVTDSDGRTASDVAAVFVQGSDIYLPGVLKQ